jgi:hypothetical protein
VEYSNGSSQALAQLEKEIADIENLDLIKYWQEQWATVMVSADPPLDASKAPRINENSRTIAAPTPAELADAANKLA